MLFLAPSCINNVCVCGLMLFLAPSIYENMDIKKGILMQLFSGSNKDFENAVRGKFRSDPHVVCIAVFTYLLVELRSMMTDDLIFPR